jgi:transcriptional regulator with XRE-family HTH domain
LKLADVKGFEAIAQRSQSKAIADLEQGNTWTQVFKYISSVCFVKSSPELSKSHRFESQSQSWIYKTGMHSCRLAKEIRMSEIFVDDEKSAKERFAKLIKQLRGDASQREFAKQLGISYTTIQDWEKQIRLPNEKNLKHIAEFLGWTYVDLVRYIFCPKSQLNHRTADSTDRAFEWLIIHSEALSLDQILRLINHLSHRLTKVRQSKA